MNDMAYKRKYKKGERITSPNDLQVELDAGRWVFLFDRPKHPGWIMSMRIKSVHYFLKRGDLAFAIENP